MKALLALWFIAFVAFKCAAQETLLQWGSNGAGQTNIPSGLGPVKVFALGQFHQLALRSNGTVAAWGDNHNGQTNVPAGLSNVIDIAAGFHHSLALKSNGSIVAWGAKGMGQIDVPPDLSNVVAIAAGAYHSLALKNDGIIVGWGNDLFGQATNSSLSNVVAISAGAYHNVALKSNGTIVAWGYNAYGQTNVPAGLTNVAAVAAGYFHNLVIRSNYTVAAWGNNERGQTNVPAGLSNIVAIAGGDYTSMALKASSPSIIVHPVGQSLLAGSSVTFTVAASGTETLSYQWKFNNANIFGATASSFTKNNVQSSDSGNYSVVVSNLFGFVTSANAALVIASDFDLPKVTIIYPPNRGKITVPMINLSGTAKDTLPGTVVDVKYRLLPETNFLSAALSGVNWSAANIALTPGTNIVHAYAIDSGGNSSLMKTNLFFYDLTNLLTVKISGNGRIKSSSTTFVTNNQIIPRLVGRPFSLTAFVDKGTNFVFTNWTDGASTQFSADPAYTFLMQPDLVLQANFIPNPFTAVAGVYNGLFRENSGVAHHSAGFFTVKLSDNSSYSAKLFFDGDSISTSGKFDLSGHANKTILRATKGKGSVDLFLDLDWSTTNQQMHGTLSDGIWQSVLLGDKATFNATNPAANLVGTYTFLTPSTNYPTQSPKGFGYGLVTNSLLGLVKFSGGALSDGAKIQQKVSLSKAGEWPLYVPLYKTTNNITNPISGVPSVNKANYRGSLFGWVTFSNSIPVGKLSWIKTAAATNYFYPAGFTSDVELAGSPYYAPSNGVRMLNIPNATITFSEGNMSGPMAWNVTWASNNVITASGGIDKPTFALTPKSGLFKGTFPHPQLGKTNFFGAVLQNQDFVGGFFLGTNKSGAMLLQEN